MARKAAAREGAHHAVPADDAHAVVVPIGDVDDAVRGRRKR